jgi:hypothetical protein
MAAPLRALLVCSVGQASGLRRERRIGLPGPEVGTSFALVRRIRTPHIVFLAVTTAEGTAHWLDPDERSVLLVLSLRVTRILACPISLTGPDAGRNLIHYFRFLPMAIVVSIQ